jgi:predicted transcriptional regulator
VEEAGCTAKESITDFLFFVVFVFDFFQVSVLRGDWMGYRSRFDIIADMLNVVSGRAKKTQIMYQANLSYRLLEKYLAEIRRSSLVLYERKGRCFVLTDKGREFLQAYREYSRRAAFVEKHINHFKLKEEVLEKLCSEK